MNTGSGYDMNDRMSSIYGNYNTSPGRRRRGGRKILKLIGLVLLVALVSVGSCAIYLSAMGYSPGSANDEYKVNQISAVATSTSSSESGELTTPQVIQKVIPSIVGIEVSSMSGSGSGSGIIFSEDGYIVTNQHVISGAQQITVTLGDGTNYQATLVGEDEKTDLAVLKVDATDLPAADIGNSDDLVQGETVLILGNPLGETLSGSTTQGIVSALGREIEIDGKTMHYIQTDAAVNPGNSGGAMVNRAGLVVGITSAKISSSSTEGLGFAIPINEAVPVIEELINNGYVSGRPIIGISGENISQQVAMIYNLPEGVYVRYVDPESGASNAGIQQGDIIVGLNDTEIKTLTELNNARDEYKAGDTVTLKVYRNGKNIDVDIVLGEASATSN